MTGSVQKESSRNTMTLTGKISVTETSCHPLEYVNLNCILITTMLHLKERKMRKWGWWKHIFAVRFWLLLCKTVRTTFSQPVTQIQSLTVTVTGESALLDLVVIVTSELNDSGDQTADSQQDQEAEETISEFSTSSTKKDTSPPRKLYVPWHNVHVEM